jgi:methionyl-tRNA formyltransferase
VRAAGLRLLFAGTPAPAVPALRALLDSPRHEVVAVLTRPDAPAGRGRRPARSPVGAVADEAGIPVLTPARPSDPEFLDALRALAPDCAPVVAYGALVPRAALDVPGHGWVNLHFSLLPAWRGAAPVQAAIRAGDDVTGATTFRLDEGLDTGPIYGVVTEAIRPADTAGDLLARLAESGARLLVATMDGIADGTLSAVGQPADGVSHAPKTPGCAGAIRRSPSTGPFARSRPSRARGRSSGGTGSASGRCGWSSSHRCHPAHSGSRSAGCSPAPPGRPSSSARCGRWASARCPPLTGPAASGSPTARRSHDRAAPSTTTLSRFPGRRYSNNVVVDGG